MYINFTSEPLYDLIELTKKIVTIEIRIMPRTSGHGAVPGKDNEMQLIVASRGNFFTKTKIIVSLKKEKTWKEFMVTLWTWHELDPKNNMLSDFQELFFPRSFDNPHPPDLFQMTEEDWSMLANSVDEHVKTMSMILK